MRMLRVWRSFGTTLVLLALAPNVRAQSSGSQASGPLYTAYPVVGAAFHASGGLLVGLRLLRRSDRVEFPCVTVDVVQSAVIAGVGANVHRSGVLAGASLMYMSGHGWDGPRLATTVGYEAVWGLRIEGRVLVVANPILSVQAGMRVR